jgi:hypothetical protein
MWTKADDAAVESLWFLVGGEPAHRLSDALTTTRLFGGTASSWRGLLDALRDVRRDLWAAAPTSDPQHPAWDRLAEWDLEAGPVVERIEEHMKWVTP